MSTGSANRGSSGDITIHSGNRHIHSPLGYVKNEVQSGNIHLQVGTSTHGDGALYFLHVASHYLEPFLTFFIPSFRYLNNQQLTTGGDVTITAGSTTDTRNIVSNTGGAVEINSGHSLATNSGEISLSTPGAFENGATGYLSLKTGSAMSGDAGHIALTTGHSTGGQGGTIELVAGSSNEKYYGRSRRVGKDGPNVQLKAGNAESALSTGGDVMLFAGHGNSDDSYDGGNGGSIELIAGRG